MTDNSTHRAVILSGFDAGRYHRTCEVQRRVAEKGRMVFTRASLRSRLGLMAKAGLLRCEQINNETIWRRV